MQGRKWVLNDIGDYIGPPVVITGFRVEWFFDGRWQIIS